MTQIPRIPLPGGEAIPQLGFGVFQVPPEDTVAVTTQALLAGYRHIDTAAAYRNEAEVAQAIRAASIPREEVFLTTKVWNGDHGHEEAMRAAKESLHRMDLEHVDLLLIHWPVPTHDRYVDTWRALIDLQRDGLARSIGVSNFNQDHLERIVRETGVTPAVNQIELHPRFQQTGLRRAHADLGIVTEAWSPLAQGAVLDDPTIVEIAAAHGVTPAQAVLRWHLQLGNVVFPKSASEERMRENLDVFGFDLDGEEMAAIEALDAGERIGPDPASFARR